MKFTNAAIINLANAIVQAGRDGKEQRNLPWKAAYALARTTSALEPHLKAMEVARKSIIEKASGGKQEIGPADAGYSQAMKELTELNEMEHDVLVHKFKLCDIEGTSMAPVVLTALLPLIED